MPFIRRTRASLATMGSGLPRPFWFIWAGAFVTRSGSFVLPFLALYLTQALHLSLSRAGLVIALYGAGGAMAGPLGGFLADRSGRRFTMVTALGMGGFGMIALGVAHRVEVLAPALFFVALVSEMYRPAMQAAVSDLVPASDRVRAFGLVYWVINVGFAIGLTLGGLIASKSYSWLFAGDGAITLIFAALIWKGVPETRPVPAPHVTGHCARIRWRDSGAALVGVGFGLNAWARSVPFYVLGVVIWTVGEMGVLPVANAVVADLAPPETRGRYQGAYSLAFGLAVCASPALGMFVLERLGGVALWSGCLGVGLVIAAGHLVRARTRWRRSWTTLGPASPRTAGSSRASTPGPERLLVADERLERKEIESWSPLRSALWARAHGLR